MQCRIFLQAWEVGVSPASPQVSPQVDHSSVTVLELLEHHNKTITS